MMDSKSCILGLIMIPIIIAVELQAHKAELNLYFLSLNGYVTLISDNCNSIFLRNYTVYEFTVMTRTRNELSFAVSTHSN